MFSLQRKGWFGQHLEENIRSLEAGDYQKIPSIFCVFSEKHDLSKELAAEALSNVLKNLEADEIIQIYERMRQTTSMEWAINWHSLNINSFFTKDMSMEQYRAVLIFSSFNPNGFIREQATMLIANYDTTLGYIILRLNDWVLEVREAAAEAFNDRMELLADGELLGALPYIEKLKYGGRGNHSAQIDSFFKELSSSKSEQDLLAGLRSSNDKLRRLCIFALFTPANPNVNMAFLIIKEEKNPFLKFLLFKNLKQLGEDMEAISRMFLQEKYALSRRLALQYLWEADVDDILEIIRRALLDKDMGVRRWAYLFMKDRNPDFNFSLFYKEHLATHPVASLYELGQTNRVDNIESIKPYLYDERSVVTCAAIWSLMRLDEQQYSKITVELLADSRSAVVKLAQQLIVKYDICNYARVLEIFWETPYDFSQRKCLYLLTQAPKWQRIYYLLEALACKKENVRFIVIQYIENWLANFNKSFVEPSDEQKANLRRLLAENEAVLPTNMKKELHFILR